MIDSRHERLRHLAASLELGYLGTTPIAASWWAEHPDGHALAITLGITLPSPSMSFDAASDAVTAWDETRFEQSVAQLLPIVGGVLAEWWERHGDISVELPAFLFAWDSSRNVWPTVRPRGFDALIHTSAGARRLLARFREAMGTLQHLR